LERPLRAVRAAATFGSAAGLVYDDALIRPWFESAVECVPGLSLFDANAHIGFNDPDGLGLSARELIETMEAIHARSVATPVHEPDGYSVANDRVLEECERSAGRLVPFCRVDPHSDGTGEARRCVEAGARGIKLHPRAERFELSDLELEGVFALAHERRLPVLIHAGRGISTIGRDALTLARRFPSAALILAHGAICDLNWIWREAQHQPNLFFDTAWWHSTDLAALFALIPTGQIRLDGKDPLALARLACDIGVDDAPETQVCRSVLALLELQERSARRGEGFAAPGAGRRSSRPSI
jgi:uncharacterized protein